MKPVYSFASRVAHPTVEWNQPNERELRYKRQRFVANHRDMLRARHETVWTKVRRALNGWLANNW